ncbi:MAG TPA: undecaprenyl/decaprenyl-phosphate alpha-N-acetylglucosaminyl 1-phosphate transferase [Candidatus Monoglobus merdigallinarum]|uniref:Undecaprenyl/decaprenyl-phosphate alpha-N-acetylglucosaminyl 1-phosphate transferase n=1 Tax=Candidatus Monoglobus merdigallinarum TaxID=2838698 RepID=A0A9D1TLI8_9FIRM|nr:undecaprenyl/decaprenyl-phosphate alpha-N-acetylglucosaminyl 1-phosphate transferase [Candidatus Monoglobus merdigallinarum]
MIFDNNIFVLLALIVAFLVAFSATPMVISLAHKVNAIDVPKDPRRIHKKPTPLMGGLAIFYGFIVSVICFGTIDREVMGILIGCVIVVTTGIIDDIKEMKPIVKLLCQILAAAVVVYCDVRIEHFANPLSQWIGGPYIVLDYWASCAVTIFWIVGICNAVNLIDGLDGLAVGVSSIASIAMLVLTILSQNLNVAIISAAVAGAGFGFLPYNYNPAKIFMGDTGALFLGFILSCISIQGMLKMSAVITFAVPVLILGLPIFDTAFAIIRRVLTGHSPMQADRGHLHHRLLDMGFSQRRVVTILYTLTAVLCMTAVVISIKGYVRGLILICSVLVIILVSLKIMGELKDPSEYISYNADEQLTEEEDYDEKD